MQACRGELTLTASIMQSSSLKVAEIGGHLVGVAQVTVKGELAELDKLFVEPTRLRSGAGKRCLNGLRPWHAMPGRSP